MVTLGDGAGPAAATVGEGFPRLDRDVVERGTLRWLRRGWPTLPDIRVVERAGVRMAVKDWSARPWWRRRLQGHFLLAREHHFLSRLEGLRGVPRSLGFPDPDSLALEWMEGQPLCDRPLHSCAPGFFDALERLVIDIHGRGVVHGDLDQYDNVLVSGEGLPVVIDFGGAMHRASWNPLARLWCEVLRLHDLHCVARLRVLYGPEEAPPASPPPPLAPWQRRLLVGFRKMDRPLEIRVHGRGEAPGSPPS